LTERSHIVAFSDSNVLLNWGVRPTPETCRFHFVTVFVNNSPWLWLGLYADADTAPMSYIKSRDVARVILCGICNGSVRRDCH
jgi:hypothetical protein